jgi:hypothetical protein
MMLMLYFILSIQRKYCANSGEYFVINRVVKTVDVKAEATLLRFAISRARSSAIGTVLHCRMRMMKEVENSTP